VFVYKFKTTFSIEFFSVVVVVARDVRQHAAEGHRLGNEGDRGGQEQELRRGTKIVRARRRVLLACHQIRGTIRKS